MSATSLECDQDYPPVLCISSLETAADSQLALGDLLLGEFLWLRVFLRLLNGLILLLQDHLDVARTGHVRARTTVSSVRATTAVLCSTALDVLYHEVVCVEVLKLSIALSVAQQVDNNLS